MRQCDSCRMDCKVTIREGRGEFGCCEEQICWRQWCWIRRVLVRGGADKKVEFLWVPPLEKAVEGTGSQNG